MKSQESNGKLQELTEEELKQVTGGADSNIFMAENIAEEATELARTQVLQQAEQAMLAQANSQAENVLGLLQ